MHVNIERCDWKNSENNEIMVYKSHSELWYILKYHYTMVPTAIFIKNNIIVIPIYFFHLPPSLSLSLLSTGQLYCPDKIIWVVPKQSQSARVNKERSRAILQQINLSNRTLVLYFRTGHLRHENLTYIYAFVNFGLTCQQHYCNKTAFTIFSIIFQRCDFLFRLLTR